MEIQNQHLGRGIYSLALQHKICKEHIEEGAKLADLVRKYNLSTHSLLHDWLIKSGCCSRHQCLIHFFPFTPAVSLYPLHWLPYIKIIFSNTFALIQHLKLSAMKKTIALYCAAFFMLALVTPAAAQLLHLPDGNVNYKCLTSRRVGVTDIEVKYNAPGVKGREGKIWGTTIANYGFMVLGFGSDVESPWRAGADECTTIFFTTDVTINGKPLAKGKYAFFIALYPDSCVLIFNKNSDEWGSYFYNSSLDVMRVTTQQQKDLPESKERLEYNFSKQTDHSVELALQWEKWRIPFTIETDLMQTTLTSIRTQLSGAMGFDPPSLQAAADWCLQNNINYEEALQWINSAVDPSLGGVKTFAATSTKASILTRLNKKAAADSLMNGTLETASITELHAYGRQLLVEKRVKEAMVVFEKNYTKNKGAWPTNGGMMRGYSAMGDLKKALEHAKKALAQAPNEQSKQFIEQAVKTLESGKPL
jgi:tetratricopeptide (TPR) repeat protein